MFQSEFEFERKGKKKRATLMYRSFLFVTPTGEISNFLTEDLEQVQQLEFINM
jgi:hypothetical protein